MERGSDARSEASFAGARARLRPYEDALREEAIARLEKKRDFAGPVVLYLFTNASLWLIWAIFGLMGDYDAYRPAGLSEARVREEMDRLRWG